MQCARLLHGVGGRSMSGALILSLTQHVSEYARLANDGSWTQE